MIIYIPFLIRYVCVCACTHTLAHAPMHINLPVPLASQSTLHSAEVNSPPSPEKSDCFSISILMSRFVKSLQEREKITGSS